MNQKKQILKGSVGLTTFIVLFMFILFGCKKNDSLPKDDNLAEVRTQSKFAQLPIIETIYNVNVEDLLVSQYKLLEQQDYHKYSYANATYQKVNFKNLENLEGLLITLSNSNQLNSKNEIFFVRDKINNSYLTILREKNNNFIKDTIALQLKNLNGSLLFNEQYINGRSIKINNGLLAKNNFYQSSPLSIKGANVVWSCTKEQFTEFYTQAKLKCESDLFCDIACSFNPCFIAYLAYAVDKCTEPIKALK